MKNWWESKAVWAAIGLFVLAIVHYIKTSDLPKTMELIFTAMAILGIRTGTQKIK